MDASQSVPTGGQNHGGLSSILSPFQMTGQGFSFPNPQNLPTLNRFNQILQQQQQQQQQDPMASWLSAFHSNQVPGGHR